MATLGSPPFHGEGAAPAGVGSWYGRPALWFGAAPDAPVFQLVLTETSCGNLLVIKDVRDGAQ